MAIISDLGFQDATILTVGCVLFLSASACLLLHDPRKASHRRIMSRLAWANLAFRSAHAIQLGFLLNENDLFVWEKAHKFYLAQVALVPHALLDQVALFNTMPTWQSVCLRVLYGLIAAVQHKRYAEPLPPGTPWWRIIWQHLLLWVLPQACIFLPYTLLTKLCPPPTPVPISTPSFPPSASKKAAAMASGTDADTLNHISEPGKCQEAGAVMQPLQCTSPCPSTAAGCTHSTGAGSSCLADMTTTSAAHANSSDPAAILRSAGDDTMPVQQPTPGLLPWLTQTPICHRGGMSSARSSAQSARAQAVSSTLQGFKAAPYKSRLGGQHKACLKLQTDLTCDALPSNLQSALQQALQQIQGPAVHITQLAVRPGCVMITMTLAAEHATVSSPVELGNQVAAALLPVTGQLLQLEPGQEVHSLTSPGQQLRAPTLQSATRRAMLQVDDHMFQIIWNPASGTWQLDSSDNSTSPPPPPPPPPAPGSTSPTAVQDGGADLSRELAQLSQSSSASIDPAMSTSPHLGLVTAYRLEEAVQTPGGGFSHQPWGKAAWSGVADRTNTGGASSAGPGSHRGAAGLQLSPAGSDATSSRSMVLGSGGLGNSAIQMGAGVWLLHQDCQLWQLPDKMAEVDGWEPPSHVATPQQLAQQQYYSIDRSQGPWQLLVRSAATGAYLTTRVQRLQHAPADVYSPRLATAKVLVELPDACLFHHHPGSTPNSLLLLTTELWQHNTLISSSPVLAIHPSIVLTAGNSTVSPAGRGSCTLGWWWGASSEAVSMAVSDITDLSQALASDAVATHQVQPQVLTFLSDLCVWLALLRQLAHLSGHCSSSLAPYNISASKQGQPGSSKKGASQQTSSAVAAYPTMPVPPAPDLPVATQHELCAGLLQYAATIGLKGVHGMLLQQQQLLKQVHRCSHQHQHSHNRFSSLLASILPSWLHPSRLYEVVFGHTCEMCEARYKQGLGVVMANSRTFLSGAAAMISAGAMLRSVVAHDWSYTACSLPWALCHVTLAALTVFPTRPKQRPFHQAMVPGGSTGGAGRNSTGSHGPTASSHAMAADRQAGPPHNNRTSQSLTAIVSSPASIQGDGMLPDTNRYLWCVVYAWWYRITITYGLCLGVIPSSTATTPVPYFSNVLCWGLILLTLAITEQQQAVTVMSTARVAQLAVFLDLPGSMWRSIQEVLATSEGAHAGHIWVPAVWARVLLAPLLLVVARLALDASLRHHILHGGKAGRPAAAAARVHVQRDLNSTMQFSETRTKEE